jgi:hypothetical protein
MALPRIPRFEYDTGPTVFQPSIPQRAWNRVISGVRGSLLSATGVGASYSIRDDHLLELTVRYLESEEPAFLAMVNFLMAWPNSGVIYPDSLDLLTFYDFQLRAPTFNDDEYRGIRDDEYPQALQSTLRIVKTDGTAWADIYHDE